MDEIQRKLLITWETDLRIICQGHYDAAVMSKKFNYFMGVPVIILSTIVGTTIFSSLDTTTNVCLKIFLGLFSISSVVLSALQTFMKYSETAEEYRKAGAKFGTLVKEIEQKMTFTNNEVTESWCNDFRERWDSISSESPTISGKIWKNQHKKQNKRRIATYGE